MEKRNGLKILSCVALLAVILSTNTLFAAKASKDLLKELEEGFAISGDISFDTLIEVLKRLGLAAVLGIVIAYHPSRIIGRRSREKALKTAKAQILICVAGALMVIVISGSIARAFGLVGLGGFVRFRTKVKDPKDLAIMFILVGIGMACGLKMFGVALFASAFMMLAIMLLEIGRDKKMERFVLELESDKPAEMLNDVKKVLESKGLSVLKTKVKTKKRKLQFEVMKSPHIDISALTKEICASPDILPDSVCWEEGDDE